MATEYGAFRETITGRRSRLTKSRRTIVNQAKFMVLDFYVNKIFSGQKRGRFGREPRVTFTASEINSMVFRNAFSDEAIENLLDEMVDERSLFIPGERRVIAEAQMQDDTNLDMSDEDEIEELVNV